MLIEKQRCEIIWMIFSTKLTLFWYFVFASLITKTCIMSSQHRFFPPFNALTSFLNGPTKWVKSSLRGWLPCPWWLLEVSSWLTRQSRQNWQWGQYRHRSTRFEPGSLIPAHLWEPRVRKTRLANRGRPFRLSPDWLGRRGSRQGWCTACPTRRSTRPVFCEFQKWFD